uniref:Uncharacterized protein n=1 Tax=Chrysotila carterae TaxID=13221 RepID=A0A7S4BL29_CHRCT
MGNVQHQQYRYAISSSFGNASEPKPGVRMSRLNTNESAARAQRQKRKPPLVVMVILASMQPKMWQELSSQWLQKQSLCGDHNFECVFYADRDEGVMEREVETKIKLIPPRKYLSDPSSMSMPRPCCAWSTHQRATNRTAPISSVSSGAGRLGPDRARSSSCGSPRFRDENPQWPLLAILSHARRSRLMKWTDGTGPSWLMMLKFNSKVNAPKLLSLLSAYDPANPLSMGDFVHASSTNGKPAYEAGTRSEMVISDPANEHASRGFELFACQGSGIVFSRAAVVKVKFSSCAQQSYQSAIGGSVDEGGTDVCAVPEMDVGACIARHHEVKLVQNASCGLCQITCSSKQWQAELAQSVGVLHKNTCFAQLSVPPQVPQTDSYSSVDTFERSEAPHAQIRMC